VQVTAHEANGQLSRLFELVEEGETVVIARRGEPVAELVLARRKSGFRSVSPAQNRSWQPGMTGGSP